jgi:hypothetical protein
MGKSQMKVRSLVMPMVAAIGFVSSTATPSKAWYYGYGYGYGYDPAPAIFAGATLALFTGVRAAQTAQLYGYPYAYGYPYPYGYLPCWHRPVFGHYGEVVGWTCRWSWP